MIEKKQHNIKLFPVILMLTVVPLLVTAHVYENHLSGYTWYSTADADYDFFLYWKSRVIMITGLLMFVVMTILTIRKKCSFSLLRDKKNTYILLGLYIVLIFLSAIFSQNRLFSFMGSTKQFQGAWVLMACAFMVLYLPFVLSDKTVLKHIFYIIFWGSGLLAVIGIFQMFGRDFFKSTIGQGIMTLGEPALAGQSLNLNFEPGTVYGSFSEPQYMASYLLLAIPFMIAGVLIMEKRWHKVMAAIIVLLEIILCGYIAVTFLTGHGISHTSQSTKVHRASQLQSVESSKDRLKISCHGHYIFLSQKFEENKSSIVVTDANDSQLGTVYHAAEDSYSITKNYFTDFKFALKKIKTNQDMQDGLEVKKDGHTWDFALIDGEYMFVTGYGKIDAIRTIPICEAFMMDKRTSERAFLWSRTLPLLSNHLLLGSGPDTFVLEFPNNDYIGMAYQGLEGQYISEPQNMYLQMVVQTGLPSVLVFVILILGYIVQAIRVFVSHCEHDAWVITAFAVAIGLAAYMIAGIMIDINVGVMPVFWTIYAVGVACLQKSKKVVNL